MSGIKHWLTPDWPAPANIHAATTLRVGGVSGGVYGSLNPAMHVGDDADLVTQNRQIIKGLLGLPGDPVWLDQIHSHRAVQAVTSEPLQQADASYTSESGIVCAVMTADCLPLLVCSTDGSQVAAIHAGWRGLLTGVISNTVSAMQQSDLLVWLGPAIGPDCFEVGAEVRDAFLAKSAVFIPAFKPQSNGKWLADIYQLARIDLGLLGIDKVYGGGFCTVTEQERFYSYRRDKETGRMATLIWRA
ncbi:peptidoglycan editing factor PgeF [Methylobacter svalbardensis]|uniref:peptidoglycan editing factor PgeF n=1 Tax=Methylobacter svalbardensis TaxID=3080016 RepID=UPI0030EED56E